MSKTSLQDMMTKRTPLGQREVVMPANLYTNPQADKTTSPQVEKSSKPQVEKYTTHLRPETIKAIKRHALDQDWKDYEVVQQAIDAYLAQIGDEATHAGGD